MRTGLKIIPLAVMLLSLLLAPASHAALTTVGPVDPATTFPAFYQDSTGLSLAPCFDNNGFCTITMAAAPGFDPNVPIAFPLNFPAEGFFFYSDTTVQDGTPRGTLYIAALEFSGTTPGTQITFARIRIRNRDVPAGDYTVTHPYGVDNITVTPADVAAGKGMFFTEDLGLGGAPFTGALSGRIGPFLKSAGGLINAPDGNVYIGNSITPVAVSGTPVTSVTIAGAVSGTSSLFILEGKVIGMSVTPSTIAFPVQRPAPFTSTPVPVTVTNLNATSPLTIAPQTATPPGISVQGANAADFLIDPASQCITAPTITPAGSCTFNVIFSGAAAGPVDRTASAVISATVGTVPKVTVAPITGIIDAIPPSVISTFPTTPTAPANINITATFSESMLASSITDTTFLLFSNGIPITGAIPVYNDANKTASIALPVAQEAALQDTVITAQITTGMTDLVGNLLSTGVTFTFTATAPDHTPPTIALFDPPDNATGVETTLPIAVTFSEPMLATSITGSVLQVTSGGVPVDGTVTVNGAVATFTPTRPFAFGTPFRVTITTDALDVASNPLAAGQVINFVTNFAPLAPDIVFPANGETGVVRPVILRWRPSVDQDGDAVQYHLFLCNNQAFIGTAPNCLLDVKITPTTATAEAKGIYHASVYSAGTLFTLFGVGFASGFKGRKKILMLIAVLVVSGLFVASCRSKSDGSPATAVSTDLTFQVEGLAPNVTYFWKMEADDGKAGVSATPVMTFTTR